MVVSFFLLCDQLSERLELSLFLCIYRLLLIFSYHQISRQNLHTNDVYFYRAMLRKAQYCC